MDKQICKVRLAADPYPPYQYEEKGEVRGIDQEIIAAAFEVHAIATETLLSPWTDCLARLEQGKADGVFQILRAPDREQLFLFSDRLRTEQTLLLRMSGRPGEPGGKDGRDLFPGQRLGVVRGYDYGPAIDRLQGAGQVECKGQKELIEALAGGLVDLILMDTGVAAYLSRELGIRGAEPLPGFEIRRSLHVAFRRDCAEIVELFNSGLAAVRKEGVYGRILDSYGLHGEDT